LAGGFAAGFSAGLGEDLGTGLTGLATALALEGTGLAAVFLTATAGFLEGAALGAGFAAFFAAGFGAGLAFATGLATFFTALAAALGAGLAFTAVLAAGLAAALAGVLVFFAGAFTMCLLWKTALGWPWSLRGSFLAGLLQRNGPTLAVARFPGLSALFALFAVCQSRKPPKRGSQPAF
jgi:hypothetical protein